MYQTILDGSKELAKNTIKRNINSQDFFFIRDKILNLIQYMNNGGTSHHSVYILIKKNSSKEFKRIYQGILEELWVP